MKKFANFDLRVKLMAVIIGMAKEAGYDLDRFILEVRTGWPHVPEKDPGKIPERSDFFRTMKWLP